MGVGQACPTYGLLAIRPAAWKHGVTVNIIAPGPIGEIETLAQAIEQCDHGAAWMGRGATSPQDAADGVAFLCSDAGRFISGCELPYLFR